VPSAKGIFILFCFSLFIISSSLSAVELVRLDNGVSLLLDERPGSKVCAIQFWVRVGSKYERDENSGVTHFIEHLIFKGSKKLRANEIAWRIEGLGGSINAFTSYDNTVYHIVVPKDSCEEGFSLLSEAVLNPVFPEEEIEKERKVVLEEIKMGEDDPQRKIYKELFSLSYGDHPYGRPIIGFPETVGKLSRREILSYFEDHYVPQNITVVVVGDFRRKTIEELAKKTLEGIPGKKVDSIQFVGVPFGGRTKIIEKDVLESYLALSYPIPPVAHEDIPVLEVLSSLLTEGESSRLIAELKNRKKIITYASSFSFAPEGEGLFVIYVNFKGREFRYVLRELEGEIKRLLQGVPEWELRKAKNQIRASYIYGMETVQGRARMIGHYYTLVRDPSFVEKLLERVDRVCEEDIKRAIIKYFGEERRNVVALIPPQRENKSNPVFGQLKNGLKYAINENLSAPLFSFSIGFAGGLKDEPNQKNGIFNVLSKMLLKGTKRREAKDIAIAIDTLGGEIVPFCGYNLFGISGKFMSKDLHEAMGLLREILMETKFSREELINVKNEVLSEIRRKEDDPVSYVFKKFNSFFYKGHPYEKDPLGNPEDVESIGIEDLIDMYKRHLSPKNCVIALSGSLNIKEAVSLIEAMFSDWEGEKWELKRERIPVKKGEAFYEKDMLQNHMIFGFRGVSLLDEERYAVEIMDAIFSGMGGRIHHALRERTPYAYATTFFNQMGYDSGVMGVYAAFDPRMLEEVKKTIRKEIESVIKDGFTEEEVERAKRYLIGNYHISMQSNGSVSYRMMVDTFFDLGPQFFKKWPEKIMQVKREEVERIARILLRLEDLTVVIVGKKP